MISFEQELVDPFRATRARFAVYDPALRSHLVEDFLLRGKCPECHRSLIYMPKYLRDAYPWCAALEVNYCGRMPTQAELRR